MRENRTEANWRILALSVVLLPAALFLYVASIGPVLYVDREWIATDTPRWITAFYWPLAALAEQSPAVEQILSRYLELWGVA
jgi:hypothetical protein